MSQDLGMFGIALLILVLITAFILGLIAGPTNPLTWSLAAALLLIPYTHKKIVARRFITWKDEYNVGIEAIDRDHRKLVNLINQLQTAVDYSTGEEFERHALEELVDYTKTHFGREEALMEEYGYPDYEPHKAMHKKMIGQVEDLLKEYEENHDLAMRGALNFLKRWLVEHINGTDQKYSGFLRDKGVR